MTKVRAACPTCGTIRIPTNHVTIRARLDAVDYAYRYTCSGCERIVVRQTTARIAYLLIDAHCPIETWALPYRGPRLGPPIGNHPGVA